MAAPTPPIAPPPPAPPTDDRRARLFAIAISIVLAAVVLTPRYVCGPTRSRISPIRSDHRSLATAIETYFVDHHAYPAWTTATTEAILGQAPDAIDIARYPTFRAQNGTALATLTTPVAYLTAYFTDPLAPDETAPFRYRATENAWLLWSAGPNRQYEISGELVPELLVPPIPNPTLLHLTYDPTNGAQSAGDVWRVNQ